MRLPAAPQDIYVDDLRVTRARCVWNLLVIERPRTLRDKGWGMETQQEARIVKGQYLEIVLGDWKTIQLYEDGMLLAKVRADDDFLAWGSRDGEGFEKHPRLNPLALVEFTYSFVDVFSGVIAHAEPQPTACVLEVNIHNALREGGPLYLNPYGLGSLPYEMDDAKYPAPEDADRIGVQVDADVIREMWPVRRTFWSSGCISGSECQSTPSTARPQRVH